MARVMQRDSWALSVRLYSFGVGALGMVGLVFRDFDLGQPVPATFPNRLVYATAADVFMIFTSAALQWRMTRGWAARALALYYSFVVVILMYGHLLPKHYREYGLYSGAAEQLAIAAGALIVVGLVSNDAPNVTSRPFALGRWTFGVCAILFGGAHFMYLNLTVPLVPTWLPPNPKFWAYSTGVAHIAAGVAILSGMHARLASVLLALMFALFSPLVHFPMLIADPASHINWSENALNIALTGAAWLVADIMRVQGRPTGKPASALRLDHAAACGQDGATSDAS